MNFKNLLLVALVVFIAASCQDKNIMKQKAIDPTAMDLSVNPGDDFNLYANGGWKSSHPIPKDKSRFGAFDQLNDENEKKLKSLVDEIVNTQQKEGSVANKVATFFKTGMDTVAIEQQGYQPIVNYLNAIDSIENQEELQKMIRDFHKIGATAGFVLYGAADKKNSEMVVTYLSQGGLGLPDRDYYLNKAERFAEIRAKYLKHIQKMFGLIGMDNKQATDYAQRIMHIETQLAEASMDRLTLRDPHKTYHKETVQQLISETNNFNWVDYFESQGLGNPDQVVVGQPEFFKRFDQMLTDVSLDDWKIYLKWHFLSGVASYLSKDFVNEDFDFFSKTLQGTPVIKPRWKRVLNATSNSLSEAVGQVYVEKYFPPEAKERMLKLVENLRLALGERIQNLDWMSDTTKKNGLEKLAAINVKIGYPDKWKDYSDLEVKNDAYVLNILRAREFSRNQMLAKINKPVDKTEWHMPPQMVNAYYSPSMNEIVFPAAILQPPFFYLDGDDAVNYGAIGVVIGHEMTHGFDDKGRFYDKDGNLNTWWDDADAERFTKRADVLVKQFDEFVVLDTVHANGKYTLGENIADLGGINISYTAFKKTQQWLHQDQKIDGFTPDQRFFLAYAHVWAQNIRDKEALRRTQEDVHSLGRYRVNGPLRNVPEFHRAFNIKETDYMYLPKEERAIIW